MLMQKTSVTFNKRKKMACKFLVKIRAYYYIILCIMCTRDGERKINNRKRFINKNDNGREAQCKSCRRVR